MFIVVAAIVIGWAAYQKRDELNSSCLVWALVVGMLLLVMVSGGAALDRDGYHSTLNRINTQLDHNRAGFCRTHPTAC